MALSQSHSKNYYVASENKLILQILNDNTNYDFKLYSGSNHVERIDLLIIDDAKDVKVDLLFQVNLVVNLTEKKLILRELMIRKPCCLQGLIQIINRHGMDNSIFCILNGQWVYNERSSTLSTRSRSILFTDKENQLFKSILQSKDHGISREALRKDVWDHNDEIESTTLETHIYKLKSKLPEGLLIIQDSNYYILP